MIIDFHIYLKIEIYTFADNLKFSINYRWCDNEIMIIRALGHEKVIETPFSGVFLVQSVKIFVTICLH